jgi:hypothetical protein
MKSKFPLYHIKYKRLTKSELKELINKMKIVHYNMEFKPPLKKESKL